MRGSRSEPPEVEPVIPAGSTHRALPLEAPAGPDHRIGDFPGG